MSISKQYAVYGDVQIALEPESHTYTLNGVPAIAVGNVVARYKEPFDSDLHSKRIAERRGVTQGAVLEEWRQAREDGCKRGHILHEHIYRRMNGWDGEPPSPECIAFDKQIFQKLKENEMALIEAVIGWPAWGICGTVDFVIKSNLTGKHHVLDWKTGKRFETSGKWRNLLPPFNEHGECELACYSIQVTLYRMILQKLFPEWEFGAGRIYWFSGENVQHWRAINMELELTDILS